MATGQPHPHHAGAGGKSPLIVLEDADVEQAALGAAMGIFFNQGQVCTAGSRIVCAAQAFCVR